MDIRFVSGRGQALALGFVLTWSAGATAPFTPAARASELQSTARSGTATNKAEGDSAPTGAVELSLTPPRDTLAVAPNILVTFDDSGSMAVDRMGDDRPFDGGDWKINDREEGDGDKPWYCAGVIDPRPEATGLRTHVMNGVYYNPHVIYLPPIKADGSSMPNADAKLEAVWEDGIAANRPRDPKDGKVTSFTGTNDESLGDDRWKCPADKASPIPEGGPYYYRLKAGVVIGSEGNPDTNNLYNIDNWEAVKVANEDVIINGQHVNQWQNWANWYAYYRTRSLMARTSISRVFGALGGEAPNGGFGSTFRVAWQNLNDSTYQLPDKAIISGLIDNECTDPAKADPSKIQESSGNTPPHCYRSAFFNWIFGMPTNGSTPSVDAADRAGGFFQRIGQNRDKLRNPYWDKQSDKDLYCRKNFHMLVTDGVFNGNNVKTPGAITQLPDGTGFNPSASYSAIYKAVHSKKNDHGDEEASLSDVAFKYWATNLRPDLYDPPHGKFVPPYLPNKALGIVPTSDMSAAGTNNAHVNKEIYFNPENDPANWPHLVQYVVGMGVSGTLNFSTDTDCVIDPASDACSLRKGKKDWPKPSDQDQGIAENIDDAWHAALASRGDYFNAGNPQDLVDQVGQILTNISAHSAPVETGAVNTSVLTAGALGFNTSYSTADWSGTLDFASVNSDGTTSTDSLRSVNAVLDRSKPGNRKIFTAMESPTGAFAGGLEFKAFDDFDAAGKALLSENPASVDGGGNDNGQARVDYLRGNRSKEGKTFRRRDTLLGAIVGSQTVYVAYPASGYRNTWPAGSPEQEAVDGDSESCGNTTPSTCHSYEFFVKDHIGRKPTVYVGANDGMLHAFDASVRDDGNGNAVLTSNAGEELFAYVPRSVYARLGGLTARGNFRFMPTVDGIPVTRDVFFARNTTTPVAAAKGWHTILVGPLRLGGRGIYALDITDPTKMTAGKVLWEFNADQPVQSAWNDGSANNPGGTPANLGYTFGQPNIGRLANGRWVVLVPGGYFPDCSAGGFTAANCSYPAAAFNKYSSLFVLDAQTGKLIREMRTPNPDVVGGAVASHGLSSPVLGDYNDDQVDDVAFAGDLDGNLWRFDLSEPDPSDWSVALAYRPATAGAQPITSMPRLFADPAINKFMVVFGTGKYLGASDNMSKSAKTQAVYGIRDLGTTATIGDLVKQTLSERLAEDGETLARGLTNYPVPANKGGWYFNLGAGGSATGERVVVTPGALFDTGRAVIQTLSLETDDPCNATIQGAIMAVNAVTGGSGGGISGPEVDGWGGGGADDTSIVGGRIDNPRTGGSLPLVTKVGGGAVLVPGSKLDSGDVFKIDDAVWRRRSWREVIQ